jgi:crotonobetainyl-CoA:carnitine CoA-transferase CaiB-like acyl-CoA transferase
MVLEGIRILDLTRVWSGPLAVRMLADMGAEVILIEAPAGRGINTTAIRMMQELAKRGTKDPIYPDGDPGEEPWNRHGLYNDFHRNKYGITLDLRKAEGKELFVRLVRISDVVAENYTPRVMANFGLDYPVLKEIKPGIIMISMPGYGMYGPYRDYPAYGTSLEQHAGFSSIMGYPDSGPYRTHSTYPDPAASLNAANALMLALWYRRRTGKGQYIDLAQIESGTTLLGEYVLDYSMNKREPRRLGNRHAHTALQGCYRCSGDDNWVAITVTRDEEWEALCKAVGKPSWTKEERFADQSSRYRNHDELDKLIQEWAIKYDHYEAMNLLQKAGVAAGAILSSKEMFSDLHLKQREYFVTLDHPRVGPRPYPGYPVKLTKTPATYRMPAPCIGQHNDYVFTELLGLSREELARLKEERVVSDGPIIDE